MTPFRGPYSTARLEADSAEEIPATAGVYIWRRIFVSPELDGRSLDELGQALAAQACLPVAVFDSTRIAPSGSSTTVRSNYLLMQRVSVGAGAVGADDLRPASVQEAAWLSEVAAAAMTQHFGPVLYVGQSTDLRQRTQQHLSGASGLRRRLTDCGLTFKDVALYFYETPPETSDEARLRLEVLLTHLTGAPLTRRPG
jgi:hypothetical protein